MIEVIERALDARTIEVSLSRGGAPLSSREVLDGWVGGDEVRAATLRSIARAPFAALFFEVAPLAASTLDAPYRHVLVDAPRLASVEASADAFAAYLGDEDVAAFDNLGGDARLVAPAPSDGAPREAYAHLAACVRAAPAAQLHALFARAGLEARAALERWPVVWVSTSGLGVSWLHVRVERRPKYYAHAPYRVAP
ncbi:MAG: hypothetical protein KF729_25400 [Sandaracinaceae bacterium]|nr:hypothetical protein [Sandaracinaceae bacterium]